MPRLEWQNNRSEILTWISPDKPRIEAGERKCVWFDRGIKPRRGEFGVAVGYFGGCGVWRGDWWGVMRLIQSIDQSITIKDWLIDIDDRSIEPTTIPPMQSTNIMGANSPLGFRIHPCRHGLRPPPSPCLFSSPLSAPVVHEGPGRAAPRRLREPRLCSSADPESHHGWLIKSEKSRDQSWAERGWNIKQGDPYFMENWVLYQLVHLGEWILVLMWF